MNNLRNFFMFAAGTALTVACSNAPEETVETTDAQEVQEVQASTSYVLVTEGDEVMWEGYKTYTEGSHVGTLQISEGEFVVEGDAIVGGTFVIDMNSINNTDLNEMADKKAKLEGHLKSPDFFAVEQYPTATFTITSVEVAEGAENGATHTIKGNLKMRDQEKNITVPAMVNMNGDVMNITTPEFVIDRTNWGVQYGSETSIEGLAKENAISDNLKLKLNLQAKKA
jgi:polyisoprenoid-binding protein YceI